MVDKTTQNLEKWCSAEGIEFIDSAAEAAYKRRTRRIADVIQLNVPDRVPVVPSFGMFPYLDNGLTCEEAVFDYEKAAAAAMKALMTGKWVERRKLSPVSREAISFMRRSDRTMLGV